MNESPVDAIEPHSPDDELVVRMARIKLALGFVLSLVFVVFVFIIVWLDQRSIDNGFFRVVARVIDIGFLDFFTVLALICLICLIGVFSPYPLFSVSHAGIRTYSIFGLFGSELTPWSEVTSIEIELSGGPRSFTVFSVNKPSKSRFALVRWLNQKIPIRIRASIMRGMTTRPMDEIVDYILIQFEREIQGYGIQVEVRGDE